MPDLLQILLAQKQKEIQDKLQRGYMPPQAGQASPTTMRAEAAVRKEFPADMFGVKVGDLPFTDPESFSNILMSTPTKLPPGVADYQDAIGDPDSVSVNPAIDMVFGQTDANAMLAHELQHIRQNRTKDPMESLREFKIPYTKRPSELEAEMARKAWTQKHPIVDATIPHDQQLLHDVVHPLWEGNK